MLAERLSLFEARLSNFLIDANKYLTLLNLSGYSFTVLHSNWIDINWPTILWGKIFVRMQYLVAEKM
jgi:hypothetical protein